MSSNEEFVASRRRIGPAAVPMIAGFMGGVVSTTLLMPLDIVKLRLQVTESANPNRPFRFFRIIGGIVKHEGVLGLYQGWTPAVIGSAVSWGGYFYFYEGFKRRLIDYKVSKQQQPAPSNIVGVPKGATIPSATVALTSLDNFVLACSAGAVMVAMTNPIWLIKTRMQLQMRRASEQHSIKPYNNMVDAFRTIIRDEGWLALYKGSGPAMLLTSHGGVQFVVYEYLRKHFHFGRVERQPGENVSVWRRLELSTGYLGMGAVAKL